MDLSHAPEAPVLPQMPSASRLPAPIRFVLVCLSSLGSSLFLYSLARDVLASELSAVSRDATDSTQIGSLLAWKLAGVALCWFADYDYLDVASLSTLINLPHYYLLSTFYTTHALACATPLIIDVVSLTVPFAVFRPLLPAHDSRRPKTPNREVAQDTSVFGLVSLFGAAAYAVVVYGAFYTWLPSYMVVHFDGLKSVEKAHSTGLPLLVVVMVPIGLASTQFLFAPAIGSPANPGLTNPELVSDTSKAGIDPATATFGQTLAWNLGFGTQGWSPRAEILAKRTATLAVGTFANAFVRVLFTIDGTETLGAAGWAGLWASAAAFTGMIYAWVANE